MNRGVLQSSPVQQMMAGNPNLWSINAMRPPPTMPHQQNSPLLPPPSSFFPHHPYMIPTSSSSSSSLPFPPWLENPDQLPESWSQLLLGGFVSEEDQKMGMGQFQPKKLENWEEQAMTQGSSASIVDVKQENSAGSYVYAHANEDFPATRPAWSPVMPNSSPKSCVTSFSSNMLDFSGNKSDNRPPPPDRSSECNSSAATGGGAAKKARVQPAPAQPAFKVRKEKLGDRITTLHQLVSPFGKTDTASVLLEAIGYIRFLQSQIEALSLPYLGNGNMRQQQQNTVHGERNSIFPEDPGQLLNDKCMKRKGGPEQDSNEEPKADLRSRGLCLVPVSCTLQVGSDNGADYWAPALNGGFR